MKPSDPFTSDSARVVILYGSQAAKLIASIVALHAVALKEAYGPLAALEYKHYFGQPGEWRAGFRTEYGLHIRGRHSDPFDAVCLAIENRLPCDPCPANPKLVPAGTYSRKEIPHGESHM